MKTHHELSAARILGLALFILIIIGVSTQRSAAQDNSAAQLAFMSDRDGNYEIYVMNADGSQTVRLTNNDANEIYPVWSPDNRRIGFTSSRDGNSEVYIMNADGSNATNLTNNAAIDIAYSWSDSGEIAFVSSRDGTLEIYTMQADGSAVRPLTDNSFVEDNPRWSPDGQHIAFVSDANIVFDLYLMDANGSNLRRLTDDAAGESAGSWSPDGQHLAYCSDADGDYEIYTIELNSSAVSQLTQSDGSDCSPSWSPDGTSITFFSNRDGNDELYIMNVDGSNPRRLTNNAAMDNMPAWSHTATLTAFPTPTATPNILTNCVVTPTSNVNLRSGPGTEFTSPGSLAAGVSMQVNGQATDSSGFVWWHLIDGLWVRSDLVSIAGDCQSLPMVGLGANAQYTIEPARLTSIEDMLAQTGFQPEVMNVFLRDMRPAAQSGSSISAMMSEINSERLMSHVQALQDCGTRHIASPYDQPGFGIGAARDYIHGQFESTDNLIVIEQPFDFSVGSQNYVGYNVIATLNGTDPNAGVIVLGAHYDSVAADWQNNLTDAPGANDNASGVAAIIEIARVLSQRPHRQTLVFVAFSAEEVGRLGSQAFVRDYVQANNLPVVAMIDLDIIGNATGPHGEYNARQIRLFSDGPNDSASRHLARTLDLFDEVYSADIDIILQDAEDRQGRFSDHLSFREAGYPAVRFIEAVENQDHQHNSTDVITELEPEYFTRATQTILAVTAALADGLHAPTNITLNTDGTPMLSWDALPEAAHYLVLLRRPGALTYDDQFVTHDTSRVWDGFVASNYEAVAIAARDVNGLIGIISTECIVP